MRVGLRSLPILLLSVFAVSAYAQSVGEIRGNVLDPSGAAVASAKVAAVNTGTGFTRSTVSSTAGTYSLPNLPVGAYTVTADAPAFKTATSQVTLDVNEQREVNFTLSLAGSTAEVNVSAAPPLLETTNATLGGLINGQQVTTLPLNGRDVSNLVLMQPGVQYEQNSSFSFILNVAANGNRGTTGSSYMDNLDTTDNELGGGEFSNFNLDAISEVRVLQNNYSAEYGRGSGNIVHLVTKSGTNEFHGSAFEYLRNSALDSSNFFTHKVPPFRRNEFGGSIGGPILKNNTFFFFQYAGFRQKRGEPLLMNVPTDAERKGLVPATNPNTGKPDTLVVPQTSLSQSVLGKYPLPDETLGAVPVYNAVYMAPENHDQWSARIDHTFSSKDTIFGRVTVSKNQVPATDPIAAFEDPSFSDHLWNNQYNGGISETHIFSPTLLNNFSIGWTTTDEFIGPTTTSVTQATFGDGMLSNYGADTTIFDLHPETLTVHDGVNWVKGRHSISTGGEFRRVYDNEYGASVGGPNGAFSFVPGTPIPVNVPFASGNGSLPAGSPSPNSLVSFMLNIPSTYQRTLSFPGFGPAGGGFAPFGVRRWHLNGWFQDDFSATRSLTLNLGLRYEYNSVPIEVAARLAGIVNDPSIANGSVFQKLVLNPKPIYFPDYTGWGPRFGLAYKLTGGTILRGGFGIFTNLPLTQTADQQAFGFPFASTAADSNVPYSLSPLPVSGLPTLTDLQGNPLPPGGNTKKIAPNTPVNLVPVANFFGGPLLVNYTDMHLRNGYTMAGNLSLEQQLPGNVVLQTSYVTNNAAKLYASEFPNAYGCTTGPSGAPRCPPPQFTPYTFADPGLGEFQLTDNHAHSTYNSLQALLRKSSPAHGVQFQVSYTWSRSIDNSTTVFNGPANESGLVQQDPFCWSCEKAVSSFDVPHRIVGNAIYALPFGRSSSGLTRKLIGGWQITTIVSAQSGFPFTLRTPYGSSEFGTDVYAFTQPNRPDLLKQPTLASGTPIEEQYFSTDVINNQSSYFGVPLDPATGLQTRPGNLGRNTFRAQSFSNTDFSVLKDTTIGERTTVQFRSEFFNLFNQHAFTAPNPVLGSNTFGYSSSTVLPERQIQFALRLLF